MIKTFRCRDTERVFNFELVRRWDPGLRKAALRKLDRLGPKLDRAYAAVRKNAPNAQVVVLGYLLVKEVLLDPDGDWRNHLREPQSISIEGLPAGSRVDLITGRTLGDTITAEPMVPLLIRAPGK